MVSQFTTTNSTIFTSVHATFSFDSLDQLEQFHNSQKSIDQIILFLAVKIELEHVQRSLRRWLIQICDETA